LALNNYSIDDNNFHFEYFYPYDGELLYEFQLAKDALFNNPIDKQNDTITNNGVTIHDN